MARRSCVTASSEQLSALQELARSERRDEADRARGMLLSLEGWTSEASGTAFGVSVRHWRNWYATGGVEALRAAAVRRARASRAVDRRRDPVRAGGEPPELDDPAAQGRDRAAGWPAISKSRLSILLREKGVLLAAASPQPDRPAGRRRGRSDRAQAGVAQGPGRGGRYYPSLCRRVRDAHPSLPRPCLGQTRRRPAGPGASAGQEGGHDRDARTP
jgi:hypothetical protein